jgi:DHA2 family multidrug resistance protein
MTARALDFAQAPRLAAWAAFAAMCTGMFMAILDIQVVATSLPTISEALGIRQDQMSWIQTSYLIAEIIAIPMTGLLTRALTMRWLSVGTTTVFTLASIGCAYSGSFEALLAWRVLQGFAGGLLIPLVFAAGFALFPGRGQATATTIAGVLAVMAPTLGPVVGGWITSTYDWPWLFLINVVPGIAAIAVAAIALPREQTETGLLRQLDGVGLCLMAVALALLELGLKDAPHAGWLSVSVFAQLGLAGLFGYLFVRRTLNRSSPLVDLRAFADKRFALGCLLSFILGLGLYGCVYLMPVFLAFVRGHDALEIGHIMVVTGIAQLIVAPFVVAAERRADARLLTACGFLLFAGGLGMSAFQTRGTDYDEMFLPQLVRGAAIMLCLLPPVRIALGHLPPEAVANASGLFNLTRNLGGAIGLALIDTVIYGRAPVIGERLGEDIQAGSVEAAREVGLPMQRFLSHIPGTPVDPGVEAYVRSAVERQALTQAINESWMMLALLTLAGGLAMLFYLRASRSAEQAEAAAQWDFEILPPGERPMPAMLLRPILSTHPGVSIGFGRPPRLGSRETAGSLRHAGGTLGLRQVGPQHGHALAREAGHAAEHRDRGASAAAPLHRSKALALSLPEDDPGPLRGPERVLPALGVIRLLPAGLGDLGQKLLIRGVQLGVGGRIRLVGALVHLDRVARVAAVGGMRRAGRKDREDGENGGTTHRASPRGESGEPMPRC